MPNLVLDELNKLLNQQKSKKQIISLSHSFISRYCRVEEIKKNKLTKDQSNDDLILSLAEQIGAIIATNDRELRKKSRSLGLNTIYLRGHSFLEKDDF